MGDTSDGELTPDSCRRVAPPNKRKMEAEVDALGREILETDNKLRSVQVKLDGLGIHAELQNIRAEKETKINNRKAIDRQLSALNAEISKKKDGLAKLKSNLQYLKEERIDEAIRRLNRELQTRNFRLNEEKKIVNEIDTLNRSKRALREYHDLNGELTKMRERQKKMRDDLNECYKTVSNLKTKETDLKSRREKHQREIESLKTELESARQKKRDVIADFRRREREYKEFKEMKEQKMKKIKEEEVKVEAKQKDIEETHPHINNTHHTPVHIEPSIEPYTEEKQLCTTLMTYLQRYVTPTDQTQSAGSPGPTDPKRIEQDGMYVLPRKREEETKYSAVVRRTSSKNKKRDRQKKIQVTHTPEIFAQFAKLNLNAPSNVTEVTVSLEQLKGRRQYYETAVPEPKTNLQVPIGPQGDATESVESADVTIPADDTTTMVPNSDLRNEFNFECVNSTQKTDAVEPEASTKVETKPTTVAPPIEEEKVSQGSDDVFFDSDDDVFTDSNQNIPCTPLKRRNFCLVSSRTEIKPLMANADFLADAIRGCGQNGFVMPTPLSMCPGMSNVIENPISNSIAEENQDEASGSSPEISVDASNQKLSELGASAMVSCDGEAVKSGSRETMSDLVIPDNTDLTCQGKHILGTSSPRVNGNSVHTDSSTGNLSDEDADVSVHDLLCELKKLNNGTSDVDIEPSTDSSDITDSYESSDQTLLSGKVKTLSLDEQDIIRPVICSQGRSSPESLEDTLKAAEEEVES